MLNRFSLALTCFKIRLQADVWRFLQRILEMGVMLIHPEHGQYMTHCNGKSVPGVLDKYEEILEHLKISVPCSSLDSGSDSESGSGPVVNLKCIFKRSDRLRGVLHSYLLYCLNKVLNWHTVTSIQSERFLRSICLTFISFRSRYQLEATIRDISGSEPITSWSKGARWFDY